jgi:lipid-A-disaccharide synthase-like uncharacterized protein
MNMLIFGILGLVIISIAIWLKKERMQDAWFVLGGAALLAYSISIEDTIFIILQIVFILSALVELLRMRSVRKSSKTSPGSPE